MSEGTSVFDTWYGCLEKCRRGDSNPHGLPHTALNRACLPISPLRLFNQNFYRVESEVPVTGRPGCSCTAGLKLCPAGIGRPEAVVLFFCSCWTNPVASEPPRFTKEIRSDKPRKATAITVVRRLRKFAAPLPPKTAGQSLSPAVQEQPGLPVTGTSDSTR